MIAVGTIPLGIAANSPGLIPRMRELPRDPWKNGTDPGGIAASCARRWGRDIIEARERCDLEGLKGSSR